MNEFALSNTHSISSKSPGRSLRNVQNQSQNRYHFKNSEGVEQEREAQQKTKIEKARIGKQKNYPIEMIAEMTALSIKEIEKL